MYALGIEVTAFSNKENDSIDEISLDKNNYVQIGVVINEIKYVFQRKINQNIISVISTTDIQVFPVNRTHTLFVKDEKTFSDWLLEKLAINIIKVENIFSSEHYLNFDDLFRYSYYDQHTSKKQMISDFGIGRNVLKKSQQMKKFIFETLLSVSNNKYYKTQRLMKEKEIEIKEKKAELSFKQKMFFEILNLVNSNLSDYTISEIDKKIMGFQQEKDNILNSFMQEENKRQYINNLKEELEEFQTKIQKYKREEQELSIELNNAKRLNKIEKKEIKTLEILSTLPSLYEKIENSCPICQKHIHKNKNKCICGNDLELNMYHFMYTKSDYCDILKSRVSVNSTTSSVIRNLQNTIDKLRETISLNEQHIEEVSSELKKINSEIISSDIEKIILSINKKIAVLSDIRIRLNILEKENNSINDLKINIEKLEKELINIKEILRKLEMEKYEALQTHIEKFEEILNEYLQIYNKRLNQEYDCKLILNKDYLPVSGKYNPHSREAEIKIFFYLSLLKYSVINSDISYPKLLIIDTIKDNGLDNTRIKKIFENVFDFEKFNCQIIMTCGYEEFQEMQNEYSDMVIERISKSKLLSSKNQ